MRIYQAPAVDRSQILNTAQGFLSSTSPPIAARTTAIPTVNAASGTLVMSLLGLRGGDLVTNLICNVQTVGTGLTFAKLGLFSSTGTFLAATASVSASFNSGTGFKIIPLTSPYTITSDGGYYVGYLQYGSGATGATLAIQTGNTAAMVQPSGTVPRAAAQVANQTDISGNVTLADSAASAWWFAVN